MGLSRDQKPLVSVIIPCFNGAAFIAAAIHSVLSQALQAIETIVVDDGSTDHSQEIVASFGDRVVRIAPGSNNGPAAARNAGLAAARGEYIKFLDADDWLAPGCVARQVCQLSTLRPDAFVVGRSFRFEENSGDMAPHSPRDRTLPRALPIEQIILDAPLLGATLYRRMILQGIGGFDEDLRYREDFDLFMRLLISGATPAFTPEVALFYRNHETGPRVSRQPPASIAEMQLGMFRNHVALLDARGGPRSRPELSAGMALAIWQAGRNVLRSGMKALAAEHFALARCCSPSRHVHGRPLYGALNAVLGPERTEHLLGRAKTVVRPLSFAPDRQVQR